MSCYYDIALALTRRHFQDVLDKLNKNMGEDLDNIYALDFLINRPKIYELRNSITNIEKEYIRNYDPIALFWADITYDKIGFQLLEEIRKNYDSCYVELSEESSNPLIEPAEDYLHLNVIGVVPDVEDNNAASLMILYKTKIFGEYKFYDKDSWWRDPDSVNLKFDLDADFNDEGEIEHGKYDT